MARQRTVASRRDRRLRPAADDAPVGRDDVLHRLRQAVDGAADGHGLTVLLTGEAGIGGKVNSHFFSRFGSSILLSILGGASSLFTGGTSTVVVSGGQSAASVAAQRDSTRPPTIKVQQGEPIRVFTATLKKSTSKVNAQLR